MNNINVDEKIESQILDCIINEEIRRVFDFKDDTILKLGEKGKINLASLLCD